MTNRFPRFHVPLGLLALVSLSTLPLHAADTSEAPAPLQLQFGADPAPGSAARRADGPYQPQRGFGLTFDTDPQARSQPRVLYRDRSGTQSAPQGTGVAIDLRDHGQPAAERPPFTLRVDLPNGLYDLALTAGDPASATRVLAHVGDAFRSDVPGALDEAQARSVMVHRSNHLIGAGEVRTETATFEVTEGYLLIGFRRNTGTRTNTAALQSITLRPLVGKQAQAARDAQPTHTLLRRGVVLADLQTEFEGPSARYLLEQWQQVLTGLTGQAPDPAAATWRLRALLLPGAAAREALRARGIAEGDLGEDGYALLPEPHGDLLIVAPRPRGVMAGVFDVIRLATGFEWVRPLAGDLALAPITEGLLLLREPVVRRPLFLYRAQAVGSISEEQPAYGYLDWMTRNGLNMVGGSLMRNHYRNMTAAHAARDMIHNFSGHALYALVPAEEFLETHPDYFPLIDGQRKGGYKGAQVNMAHPEVSRIAAERLAAHRDAVPTLQVMSLGTNDTDARGSGFGAGEDEQALDDPRDLQQSNYHANRSYATRYIHFANRVAEHLAATHPDVQLNVFAYADTIPAPHLVPHPNLLIQFSPLYKSMNQAINSAASGRNAQVRQWLEGWAKLTPNILMREYYVMIPRTGASVLPASLYTLQEDLRYYRDLGIRGFGPEMIPDGPNGANANPDQPYPAHVRTPAEYERYWDATWLLHFGTGRLLWDPDQPIAALIQRACDVYYGPAAEKMAAYHDQLHRHYHQSGRPEEVLTDQDIRREYGGRVHTGPHDLTWNWLPTYRKHAEALFDLRGLEEQAAGERLQALATLLAEAQDIARRSRVLAARERVDRDIAFFEIHAASLGYEFEFRRGIVKPRTTARPNAS